MDALMEGLIQDWHKLLSMLPQIALALIAFVLSIGIGRALSRGFIKILERGHFSQTHKSFFRAAIVWLFSLMGLIIALNFLGLRGIAASLLAGGGVTAVIIGFAFREIGENFLAGFVLAFSRPFEVGDLIQSENLLGEVRGLELRHTHIRSHDGCDIFIPSSQIINKPLMNFTRDGLRRPSFTVGIDYADDSDRARRILLKVVQATEGVLEKPPPDVTISALAAQYVELDIFFWIDTFAQGVSLPAIRTNVMERCRRALIKAGLTLSSNVTTNVEIGGRQPLDFRLIRRRADQ